MLATGGRANNLALSTKAAAAAPACFYHHRGVPSAAISIRPEIFP
jgi:hypothetical protein